MEELSLKKFEEAAEKVKEVTLATNLVYSEYFSRRSSLARGLMYVHLPLRDSLSSSQSESVVRLRTVSGSMEGR